MSSLDYDQVATEFDRRYELHDYPGIRACLLNLVAGDQRPRVLEIGCGTGEWLPLLASAGCQVAGIDPADQMLSRARARVDADLRQGVAEALPWGDGFFDSVICVNAFHHFSDAACAVRESFRVLRPGGKLLSIGLDPHRRPGDWYIYEYFPEAFGADLKRFPSYDRRASWLSAAGFVDLDVRSVEHLQFARSFPQAIQDGVLERSFTSQLGLLSEDQYAIGMRRIREAARHDEHLLLRTDLELDATQATKPV